MNKKGTGVQDMVYYGIFIVVLGIVLAIGVSVNDKMVDSFDLTSETVFNETITGWTNISDTSVSRATYSNFKLTNILSIQNESDGWLFDTSNYSFYTNNATLSWDDDVNIWANLATNGKNVTYTCSYCNGTECSTLANSTEGLAEFANWTDTIALVIAGMVILGLVFGLFTIFRRNQ